MNGIDRVMIVVIMVSGLISVASATAGTATFYTDLSESACYGSKPEGTMIAAANPQMYNHGKICGQRIKVRCTGATNNGPKPCRGGTITVRIVDLCPECGHNQIDLSEQAFSKIANPDAGKVRINFDQV